MKDSELPDQRLRLPLLTSAASRWGQAANARKASALSYRIFMASLPDAVVFSVALPPLNVRVVITGFVGGRKRAIGEV